MTQSQSSLVIYNWAPWPATVQLNDVSSTPWSPLGAEVQDSPDARKYGYYPYSQKVPRNLAETYPENNWGRKNNLLIAFGGGAGIELNFRGIEDPGDAVSTIDVALWVLPDRVVFSQLANYLSQVTPT